MEQMHLYRKRLIPDECIPLIDDEVIFSDESVIITRWSALKPKKELHHGLSCYFLKEGYKVSKFLREDDSLMYWYCDIIKHDYLAEDGSYIFTDLLADVIIYPNGFVKVVDLEELSDALEKNLISVDELKEALRNLSSLLKIIYSGNFSTLQKYLDCPSA